MRHSVEIVVGINLTRLFRDCTARWAEEVVSELIPKFAFLFITKVFFLLPLIIVSEARKPWSSASIENANALSAIFNFWHFWGYFLPTILRILNERTSLVYILSLSVVYTLIVAWDIPLFVEVSLEMTVTHSRPIRSVSSKKAKRQKQCRRKSSLMKKAREYSKMCDADVCLGIRLRESG